MNNYGSEPCEAKVVRCLLFISCCDSTEAFDSAKESFNDVAVSVACAIVPFFDVSRRIGRNAGLPSRLSDLFSDRIAIVRCISDNMFWMQLRQQSFCLRCVTAVPGRK